MKNFLGKAFLVFMVLAVCSAMNPWVSPAVDQQRAINGCELAELGCTPNQGTNVNIGETASYTIWVIKGGPCSEYRYRVIDPNSVTTYLSTPSFVVLSVGLHKFEAQGKNQWGWGYWKTCPCTNGVKPMEPICKIVSMSSEFAPAFVEFDGSESDSHDPSDPLSTGYWDFNDGSLVVWGLKVGHMFERPGIYNVKFTMVTQKGKQASSYCNSITIGKKPLNCISRSDAVLLHFTATPDTAKGWYRFWDKEDREWKYGFDVVVELEIAKSRNGKPWDGYISISKVGYPLPEAKNPDRPKEYKEIQRISLNKKIEPIRVRITAANSLQQFKATYECEYCSERRDFGSPSVVIPKVTKK